jgi:chromosome segregation ATPase
MPDPNPRDVRRLENLERRLAQARATQRDWAQERRTLRAELRATQRAARANETEVAKLTQQVDALAIENQRLAEDLDNAKALLEPLDEAASSLRADLDVARSELAETARARDGLATHLDAVNRQLGDALERLRVADALAAGDPTQPVLPPAVVSNLIDGLVGNLRGAIPGMRLRDGELRLKVGFGSVGDTPGFVVPTADAPPEMRDLLHEVTMRFEHDALDALPPVP